MKHCLLLLNAMLLGLIPGICQHKQIVTVLSNGDSLRRAGYFKEAIPAYQLELKDDSGNSGVVYNLACSYSLAMISDSAVYYLRRAVNKDPKLSIHALLDPDFLPLRSSLSWREIETYLERAYCSHVAIQDLEYSRELWEMGAVDQAYYKEIALAESKYGTKSEEVLALWKLKRNLNEQNRTRLEKLVETRGWPKKSEVGEQAAEVAFLVVQHSDLSIQKKYLSQIELLAHKGEASWQSYALLYDRIQMSQNKPQKYGSQVKYDTGSKKYRLYPLLDSSKVEIWRKEAGMESLSDYAAKWGIYFQNGKNEKFQRHENIIYFEDFSAYALGKMPSTWVFKDKHISDRGGLAALEPKSAFQILQSSRALVCLKGNVCFFRPVEDNVLHGYRTNLTLECDFLMAVSDATYGGSFGILLGKNNDYRKDYLLLSFNQDHLEIICQGNRYFSRTIAILSIMDSTWHTVGLSYEWDDVKVFLDNNYLITVPSCVYPDFFQLEGADLFAIRKVIVTHDDPALRPFKIAVPEPMNINFEVDQSFIKPYDTLFMLHVVDWLKIHSDYTIKVMGYADHDGDSVYNVKLSLRRAEAVKNELLRFGLQSNRIALKAFGFNKPLDRSNTNEGKALNRRVEFVVDKLPKNMESPVSSHDTGTP